MFEYEISLESKTADQLSEEITRINERLFKTNPSSPIYKQLLSMRALAEQAYTERLVMQQNKHFDDSPIEIGYAESTEEELAHNGNELLLAVVNSYVKNPEPRK